VFNEINGATDQTYFPNLDIDGCDTANYIVASSLDGNSCWSTTVNCFEDFGLRECDGPKSKSNTSEFLLYPNPASGQDIMLENLNLELNGRYAIDLFDLTGKNLMSEIIQIRAVGNIPIELPQLKSGVYLFRVSNPKYSQSFKLIINQE
jgi:hypothetical protein